MPHTPLAGESDQPVDRNPMTPCDGCGTTARWSEIKSDGSEWTYSNDPEEPMLCPACSDATEPKDTDRRREENHDIGAWQS